MEGSSSAFEASGRPPQPDQASPVFGKTVELRSAENIYKGHFRFSGSSEMDFIARPFGGR